MESEMKQDGDHKITLHAPSKEKSLTLTFGERDCNPTNLRLFLNHYDIAKSQNQRKKVDGWADPEFRANELRFQLRGEPALWLAQEYSMSQEWIRNDDKIS